MTPVQKIKDENVIEHPDQLAPDVVKPDAIADKFFQHGSTSMTTGSAGSATGSISYTAFAGSPIVTAISNKKSDIHVNNVTSSAATVVVSSGGSAVNHTISWQASYK